GDNLVLRAARALAVEAGIGPGAAITLVKRLPVAAGLGGGSADAAAALWALTQLWNIPAGRVDLMRLAGQLGADVPACLGGRTAFIGGVGEDIAPAPSLPPAGLVLVNPRVALPTARVFAERQGGFSQPARFAAAPRDARALAGLLAARGNDLTDAARRLVPAIDDVLAALTASPGCRLARMSGSGATCFGLYDDAPAAARAAEAITASASGWWIMPTRLRG
ncbi:MAG: 4-(cytidine 5'-diphospho)-2-C-methyl-D-erythritol kinase, partial [Rhodospirillales bacterium]|nr:4-(cytidine 5'-diphospho)-2-C-methyl-D-erythritol kinase [Rhodospirillales bacterium]